MILIELCYHFYRFHSRPLNSKLTLLYALQSSNAKHFGKTALTKSICEIIKREYFIKLFFIKRDFL